MAKGKVIVILQFADEDRLQVYQEQGEISLETELDSGDEPWEDAVASTIQGVIGQLKNNGWQEAVDD